MAKKKTTLTDNQIMILLHADRGDLADVCDLSEAANMDGSHGQDIAYLQAKGLLTAWADRPSDYGSQVVGSTAILSLHWVSAPKTTDAGEMVIARLMKATEH